MAAPLVLGRKRFVRVCRSPPQRLYPELPISPLLSCKIIAELPSCFGQRSHGAIQMRPRSWETNWQRKGNYTVRPLARARKSLAQGPTSMPKHLESRTDWNVHAAQTDGR